MSAIPEHDVATAPNDDTLLRWRTTCSSCGAPVPVTEETRALVCRFCGEGRLVDRARPLALFQPHTIPADDTALTIKRWMRAEGHRATKLGSVVKVLIPYWGLRRTAVVWPDEALVDGGARASLTTSRAWLPALSQCAEIFATEPDVAGDVHCYPVSAYYVGSDVLVADCQRDAATTDELRRRALVEDTEDEALVRHAVVDERYVVLYRPFHLLRYSFRSDHFTIVVSGRSGEVLGRVAGDVALQSGCAVAGKVLLGSGTVPQFAADCPTCERRMFGAAESSLLHCRVCRQTWTLSGSRLVAVGSVVARGEGHTLPFWRVRLHLPDAANGDGIEASLPFVYVPAFADCPPALMRRLTIAISESTPTYEEIPGAPTGAPPCTLSREAASRISEIALPELAPAFAGGWDPAVSPARAAECEVVWVPFRLESGFFVEPMSGAMISEAVFGS